MTGYTQDELVGKPAKILKNGNGYDALPKGILKKLSTFKELNTEASIRKKDTSKLLCDLTATPIFDEFDAIRYYIFNFRDITYKTEIEDLKCVLTEEMELSMQYKDVIDEGSIVSKTNVEGIITHVNDIFCDVSQYGKNELIGVRRSEFRHPDMAQEVFQDIWETILNKRVWHGVIKHAKKDGSTYFVQETVKPILDTKGNIVEFISIGHDITERILAEQKIFDALNSKNAFFAKVSHELRTPLNAIINFSEIILEDYDSIGNDKEMMESSKDLLQRIDKNSKHLLALINDLLDISKLETKQLELSKIHVCPTIQNAVDSVIPSAEKKGLLIHVCCNTGPISIIGNERALFQIFLNLLSNAIKFTEDGFISISSTDEGEYLLITIEDSGIGIPEDKIAKIFEPFEQARASDEGTGLGLKLVKEMCEAMSIKINVESQEDNGTVFKLLLRKAQ